MPTAASYSLDFTIEEGEKYRVGLIKVFGNCSTETKVILNETLLIPGEIFNSVKLQLTEEKAAQHRILQPRQRLCCKV